MNYELAKELKDAGFPQKDTLFVIRKKEQGLTFKNTFSNIEVGDDWIAAPSLSELIDACGNDFGDLLWNPKSKKWSAHTQKLPIQEGHYSSGPTPEEAVAKLWLILNKK